MVRKIKLEINFSNKWLYTLIVMGILILGGIVVGIYAAVDTTKGWHSVDQIEGAGALAAKDSISWADIDFAGTTGLSDGIDNAGAAETDPTVSGWAKANLCICIQCSYSTGGGGAGPERCVAMGSYTGWAYGNQGLWYGANACRVRLYAC